MADSAPKTIQLSAPMIELLTDIATKPHMFITRYSSWSRTARALISRGFAVEAGGGDFRQYELRITAKGRAEAARRGLISPNAQP
ncbi:hypothetical protein [Micromonospora tulbaghiae]|uniref:hypothetical protein n=1 Tax=Micromonospora tulbaghiae TaxID=479978 RepID=UPI0033C0899A